ncbi:unnamed protein product [Diplocarpon coronariae]
MLECGRAGSEAPFLYPGRPLAVLSQSRMWSRKIGHVGSTSACPWHRRAPAHRHLDGVHNTQHCVKPSPSTTDGLRRGEGMRREGGMRGGDVRRGAEEKRGEERRGEPSLQTGHGTNGRTVHDTSFPTLLPAIGGASALPLGAIGRRQTSVVLDRSVGMKPPPRVAAKLPGPSTATCVELRAVHRELGPASCEVRISSLRCATGPASTCRCRHARRRRGPSTGGISPRAWPLTRTHPPLPPENAVLLDEGSSLGPPPRPQSIGEECHDVIYAPPPTHDRGPGRRRGRGHRARPSLDAGRASRRRGSRHLLASTPRPGGEEYALRDASRPLEAPGTRDNPDGLSGRTTAAPSAREGGRWRRASPPVVK